MQESVFSDVFSRVESGFNHFLSVIRDPRARVAAISAADKEISAATQFLRFLRNALAPISLLPPEVLARVFHFLLFEEPACSVKQNLGWIRATHVCRFWRQVALGDSSLWARISGIPANVELISEILARARNAPLDVDIDLDWISSPEALLRVFTPHLFHTRELRLQFMSILQSAGFQDTCSREAPTLKHFELRSVYFPIIFRELDGTTLFKGRAPKLRTCSLSLVLIPWSLIPRGQLTRLEVSLINEAPVDFPPYGDLNQLIDLLVNCPDLEVLVLGCCLPSRLSQSSHGQTIHLPRLSRLGLVGSSSRVMNIFRMLKLPSLVTLHLHCFSEITPAHNDHFLVPAVSSYLQSPARLEFKSLNVALSDMNHSFDVTASTSLPPSGFDQPDAEFVLSFDRLPEFGHWAELFEQACKILPISNVESLSISAPDIADPVNWVELFKCCTKVTTMQATGRGTSSLVRALNTPKASSMRRGWKGKKSRRDNRDSTPAQLARSATSRSHVPIFPKLTLLSLKRLNFAENKHPSGILFRVVQSALRQRKAAYRAALEMLCIDDCAISIRRAKALQNLVQDFHWDGEVGFPDEFEDFEEPARMLDLGGISFSTGGE